MQSFGLHPADSRPVKKRKIVEEEEEEWGGILDPEQGSDSEEDSEEDEAEAGSGQYMRYAIAIADDI